MKSPVLLSALLCALGAHASVIGRRESVAPVARDIAAAVAEPYEASHRAWRREPQPDAQPADISPPQRVELGKDELLGSYHVISEDSLENAGVNFVTRRDKTVPIGEAYPARPPLIRPDPGTPAFKQAKWSGYNDRREIEVLGGTKLGVIGFGQTNSDSWRVKERSESTEEPVEDEELVQRQEDILPPTDHPIDTL
ncbi:MAG: hypothetical protein M1838_003266 [Thelocarpon superellum]|nr:MAG: hypothetical protein M1838_003266 [Thelocarpon superellum]